MFYASALNIFTVTDSRGIVFSVRKYTHHHSVSRCSYARVKKGYNMTALRTTPDLYQKHMLLYTIFKMMSSEKFYKFFSVSYSGILQTERNIRLSFILRYHSSSRLFLLHKRKKCVEPVSCTGSMHFRNFYDASSAATTSSKVALVSRPSTPSIRSFSSPEDLRILLARFSVSFLNAVS